jgi:hypothetical protein
LQGLLSLLENLLIKRNSPKEPENLRKQAEERVKSEPYGARWFLKYYSRFATVAIEFSMEDNEEILADYPCLD